MNLGFFDDGSRLNQWTNLETDFASVLGEIELIHAASNLLGGQSSGMPSQDSAYIELIPIFLVLGCSGTIGGAKLSLASESINQFKMVSAPQTLEGLGLTLNVPMATAGAKILSAPIGTVVPVITNSLNGVSTTTESGRHVVHRT